RRRPLRVTGLDLAVVAFCTLTVALPAAVILLGGLDAGQDEWRVVISPLQYLAVYALFTRSPLSPRDRRLVLQLTMLASLPMAAVALLQYANVGGARSVVDAFYPAPPLAPWENVYRPTALP